MSSVKKDLLSQKGSLVTLYVKPRKSAKKNIYVIGGENDKTKYFRLRVPDTALYAERVKRELRDLRESKR